MDSYDKYYTKFVRPPFAPVYTPTAEEFTDPIAYVAKIRHEAEPYGVVKIVPPPSFKPPFAIDTENFEFTPRIQRLNEIDAIVRERLIFNERLSQFWALKCQPFDPVYIDGKIVNLYKLYILVKEAGGFASLERRKAWGSIAKKLGLRSSTKLKEAYQDIVLPFILTFENVVKTEAEESKVCKESPQNGQRPNGRMMAGLRTTGRMMAGIATRSSQRRSAKDKKAAVAESLAQLICMICKKGDFEEKLASCETCGRSCHIYCCKPKLETVPDDEWKCSSCVTEAITKVGTNFGFYDANQAYTIHSFKEYADKFKANYFNTVSITEVPDTVVEKEFWKCIINQETTVSVKYGADLITSKVGSGFPRKTDDHRGPEARLKQHYANHAWNLNNLPVLKESVLSHIDTGISGMMVPWVYVGMCFSTFCWHTEDHWTYSINYNHWGERKIWYGLGGQDAEKFEQVVRELAPELTTHQKDIFHHMTTAVNPALLRAKGVDVYTVHQNAGEFVITFPRAYHAGYNEGVNFAEAVNFAPIDWLKSGRLCVTEYANVKRFCVFSHDELVLKMVNSCDKLGIAMSLASLEEMLVMIEREKTLRDVLRRRGVRQLLFQEFENLPDDSRCCRKCNTTLFLSGLCCSHDHTVCLEHSDDICEKCSLSQCTLKFRFNVNELEPLVKKLEQRTTLYFDWAGRVEQLFDEKKHKPRLAQVEELLEQARKKHFPHTAPLQKLLSTQKACLAVVEKVQLILSGKMRTRKETRIQRADTRLDMGGVRELLAEINNLPCDLTAVHDQLEDMLVKVEEWCDAVDEAIDNDCSSEVLNQLRKKGEEFEIRTPQMDDLRKQIEREEWRKKASEIISWIPEKDMEDEEDFLRRDRFTVDHVQKWLREAADLNVAQEDEAALHEKVKAAIKLDTLAEKVLNGRPTVEQVEQLWQQARGHDWCSSKGIDWLRREVLQARNFDFKDISDACNLKKLNRLLDKSQKSTILSSTDSYGRLEQTRKKLVTFTQKMINLFKPRTSYYSLVEIISDRDDLAALIEGQAVPRLLEETYENPAEEWDLLYEFSSVDELKEHMTTLRTQETILMKNLKQHNATRPLQETCVCGQEKEPSSETIACMLCRCRYHAACCEWNSFFGQLPLGSFLCIRCLRGKRPFIDDVQAAVNAAPATSMEVVLVKNLLEKVRQLTKEALALMRGVPHHPQSLSAELLQKGEAIVEGILGSEIVDLTVFNRVVQLIPFIFHDLLASQSKTMEVIRDRPVRAKPLEKLFLSEKKSRKRSNGRDSRKDKKRNKCPKNDEICSADPCLRPLGRVTWVQCEAGCSSWYHCACVGVAVEGLRAIAVYSCQRCDG